MNNPCKKCSLSASEKAACCGCWNRLEWERERKNTSDKLIYDKSYEEGFKAGCDYFVQYMRSTFGLYLVRSDEEVAELRKTHPDLFCLSRKKEENE